MSTSAIRRAFWGGLMHHDAPCPECEGPDAPEDDRCGQCTDEGTVRWGSFYGHRGGCDFCDHGGDGDVLVASMYENGSGQEWVCLRCYLGHHCKHCGCALWVEVEAAARTQQNAAGRA